MLTGKGGPSAASLGHERERERERDRDRDDDLRRVPPLLRLDLLDFLPFAPPVRLLTVAHAMRSALLVLRPRRLALLSMWDAIRFCFEL